MRHLKRGRKLNRTSSHRSAMLSNMASSLVFYKRIRTTLQKAKTLSPYVERLITYSKYNDKLHGRRLIMSKILGKNSKKVANLYFTGQLTVPGPGVPPALISGKLVSELIIKDN